MQQALLLVAAPRLLRVLLLVGCALAVILAIAAAAPAPQFVGDPALASLLRGMALIKACAVVAAVGALMWRFGHRVTGPVALGYCAGVWVMTAATVLVFELTRIPLAAVVFHAALIGLLVTAWRDDNKAGRDDNKAWRDDNKGRARRRHGRALDGRTPERASFHR